MALKGIAFCDTWVGRNFRLAIFLILWGGKDEDMEQEKKRVEIKDMNSTLY